MAKIKVSVERCKGCGLCVIVCPKDNLRMSEELNESGHPYAAIVDPAKCIHCAMCGRMCPDVAIEIDDDSKKSSQSES